MFKNCALGACRHVVGTVPDFPKPVKIVGTLEPEISDDCGVQRKPLTHSDHQSSLSQPGLINPDYSLQGVLLGSTKIGTLYYITGTQLKKCLFNSHRTYITGFWMFMVY